MHCNGSLCFFWDQDDVCRGSADDNGYCSKYRPRNPNLKITVPTLTYYKKDKYEPFVYNREYDAFIKERTKEQGNKCPFCKKPKAWYVRLEYWRGTKNHKIFSFKEKRNDWVVCWFECAQCHEVWTSGPFMINLKRYMK